MTGAVGVSHTDTQGGCLFRGGSVGLLHSTARNAGLSARTLTLARLGWSNGFICPHLGIALDMPRCFRLPLFDSYNESNIIKEASLLRYIVGVRACRIPVCSDVNELSTRYVSIYGGAYQLVNVANFHER